MNIANVIRNLIIRAKAEGVEQAAGSLKSLAQAHEQAGKAATSHGQASETSARRQLSMEQAFDRLERRFNTTARAQQDYARVQAQVNAAVAQNPALQNRANEVLALAAVHYGRAGQAQSTFAAGMQAVQTGAVTLASRLGGVGSVLVGLGPAGVAAGAGLGLLAFGVTRVMHASSDLADRAGKLVDFAQTTGLTTDALQALVKAGAQVGVEADKVGTSIERFTVNLEQLRKGSGDLYDAVRQVDQGLAEQLASSRSTAEAWDLLSQAYRRAEESQRNLIAKGAFGQRNLGAGRLLGESAEAGGLDALIQKSRELGAIDEKRLRTLDQIGDRLNELRRSSIDRFLIRGAEHELKVAEEFYGVLNKIQDWMDRFNMSSEFTQFITFMKSVATGGTPTFSTPSKTGADAGPGLAGAARSTQAPSPEFDLARYKEFIAVLGAAATPAEQLKLKIMELNIAAKNASMSQADYNRALAALNAQSTAGLRERIAQQQFENNLIGRSAAEVARMRAEWDALAPARQAAYAAGAKEIDINQLLDEQGDEVRNLINELGRLAEQHQRLTEEASRGAQRRTQSYDSEADALARARAEAEAFARATAFIPSGTYTLGQNLFMGKNGYSQFRPEGYQSTLEQPMLGGNQLRAMVDDILGRGGSLEMAIGALQGSAPSFERDKLIHELNERLQALTSSTDALNDSISDILSPLYGTDPRTTNLGYRAGSGVYRPQSLLTDAQIGGPYPGWTLPGMASGGEMTVPGGYSSVDNALLPVASGERIRVDRGEDEKPAIIINAPITINGMSGDRSDARESAFQLTQALSRAVQEGLRRG